MNFRDATGGENKKLEISEDVRMTFRNQVIPNLMIIRKYLLPCVVLAVSLIFDFPASAATKPNVLFILTEDQGAQAGFLGTPGLETPSMDALAKKVSISEMLLLPTQFALLLKPASTLVCTAMPTGY
ncbi:MAG: hypothetical protein HC845_10245 [Akkermansiaceae bacterium]|nr:hypothetical protein [Akkermansiaceae bacterium]